MIEIAVEHHSDIYHFFLISIAFFLLCHLIFFSSHVCPIKAIQNLAKSTPEMFIFFIHLSTNPFWTNTSNFKYFIDFYQLQ